MTMEAVPLEMYCCPQLIRVKGSALYSIPVAVNKPQVLTSRGNFNLIRITIGTSAAAAMTMRHEAVARGEKSVSATSMHIKAEDQIAPSRTSLAVSVIVGGLMVCTQGPLTINTFRGIKVQKREHASPMVS